MKGLYLAKEGATSTLHVLSILACPVLLLSQAFHTTLSRLRFQVLSWRVPATLSPATSLLPK